jgi:hypothetical protein
MAVRSVFVQFEHATFPVWADTDGRVTDRDGPLDLPIGESLREDFRRWNADMDRQMSAKSPSDDRIKELNERGLALAQRLQRELGAGYAVEYYDEASGEVQRLSWAPQSRQRGSGWALIRGYRCGSRWVSVWCGCSDQV